MRPPTLLGVWAHPDDEAYLSAGLMAEFRQRGDRVAVITATLGEHGTADPATWPPRRLAATRHAELRSSLAALDVDELYVLGYEDGQCGAQPDGADVIARYLAVIEPDLIVTFGPDGLTGHPDHRMMSRWTTDAWRAVRPEVPLWYVTVTPEFHRRWGQVNDEVGFWVGDHDPPCTPPRELARGIRLPDRLLDLKVAALEAHVSQTSPVIEALGSATFREWWRTESFRRADGHARHRARFDHVPGRQRDRSPLYQDL